MQLNDFGKHRAAPREGSRDAVPLGDAGLINSHRKESDDIPRATAGDTYFIKSHKVYVSNINK